MKKDKIEASYRNYSVENEEKGCKVFHFRFTAATEIQKLRTWTAVNLCTDTPFFSIVSRIQELFCLRSRVQSCVRKKTRAKVKYGRNACELSIWQGCKNLPFSLFLSPTVLVIIMMNWNFVCVCVCVLTLDPPDRPICLQKTDDVIWNVSNGPWQKRFSVSINLKTLEQTVIEMCAMQYFVKIKLQASV